MSKTPPSVSKKVLLNGLQENMEKPFLLPTARQLLSWLKLKQRIEELKSSMAFANLKLQWSIIFFFIFYYYLLICTVYELITTFQLALKKKWKKQIDFPTNFFYFLYIIFYQTFFFLLLYQLTFICLAFQDFIQWKKNKNISAKWGEPRRRKRREEKEEKKKYLENRRSFGYKMAAKESVVLRVVGHELKDSSKSEKKHVVSQKKKEKE